MFALFAGGEAKALQPLNRAPADSASERAEKRSQGPASLPRFLRAACLFCTRYSMDERAFCAICLRLVYEKQARYRAIGGGPGGMRDITQSTSLILMTLAEDGQGMNMPASGKTLKRQAVRAGGPEGARAAPGGRGARGGEEGTGRRASAPACAASPPSLARPRPGPSSGVRARNLNLEARAK